MTQVYDLPPPGILRPSNAHRWANCAGSFRMEGRYPQDDGEEARAGTAAHFYLTERLQGRPWPVGHITPNGVPIDGEMVECAKPFLEHVAELANPQIQRAKPPTWGVEQPVTAHGLVHPECEGTPDFYFIDWDRHAVHVMDYKYGHGFVDPFENEQPLIYLAGVFERHELTLDDVKGWECHLTIVQPRYYGPGGPVRTWRLLGHIAWARIAALSNAALAAKQPDAATITGKHCTHCTARHACDALQKAGGYALDLAGSNVPHELAALPLGLLLRHIRAAVKRLEALETGLEASALARLRAGERIPYWQVGFGERHEKWVTPLVEVIALGDAFGVDLRKEACVTPKEALKLGVDATVIAAYSEKPHGAAKLVPLDESTAAKAFS